MVEQSSQHNIPLSKKKRMSVHFLRSLLLFTLDFKNFSTEKYLFYLSPQLLNFLHSVYPRDDVEKSPTGARPQPVSVRITVWLCRF